MELIITLPEGFKMEYYNLNFKKAFDLFLQGLPINNKDFLEKEYLDEIDTHQKRIDALITDIESNRYPKITNPHEYVDFIVDRGFKETRFLIYHINEDHLRMIKDSFEKYWEGIEITPIKSIKLKEGYLTKLHLYNKAGHEDRLNDLDIDSKKAIKYSYIESKEIKEIKGNERTQFLKTFRDLGMPLYVNIYSGRETVKLHDIADIVANRHNHYTVVGNKTIITPGNSRKQLETKYNILSF